MIIYIKFYNSIISNLKEITFGAKPTDFIPGLELYYTFGDAMNPNTFRYGLNFLTSFNLVALKRIY